MGRVVTLVYGVVAYLAFMAAFVYMIGFVGGAVVPKTIDSGPVEPLGRALAIDVALLLLFAVPHSVMARDAFKSRWTRVVPSTAERSTYVLVASLIIALVFWQWRPLPGVIFSVESSALRAPIWAIFWAGWAIVLLSTFMVDHFDLTGLRHVYLHFRGQEYAPVPFKTAWLYKLVRHPLMSGFILALWATPLMTVGHALFAAGMTAYILVGVELEERDLVRGLGDEYLRYRKRVPKLVPLPRGRE